MDESKYTITERRPTAEEFIDLIESVGWSRYTNRKAIPDALNGTLVSYVATCGQSVVGMGRLIGDGYRFVYIQDLVVHPDHQRRGVGSAVMDRIVDYINRNCPKKTYVHLFTTKKDSPFYSRYGFKGPEQPFSGMSLKKFDKPIERKGD
ncbi:MAG: GNAT family N-acetyltransferase [Verrucomicrobiota bacterium]